MGGAFSFKPPDPLGLSIARHFIRNKATEMSTLMKNRVIKWTRDLITESDFQHFAMNIKNIQNLILKNFMLAYMFITLSLLNILYCLLHYMSPYP